MTALFALLLTAAEIPRGTIVNEVKCEADAAQAYALYLPSNYSAARAWPVILAFDPRGRGRTPVERYQAAAEKFGYIVAGSHNSRNGSWAVSMKAAEAMASDVERRFRIDAKRIYTAGMSGGARVALAIALGSDFVAGVVASSAGYPDSQPRKTVPFAVFATAGTEDFNYHEVRELDRALDSPHRLAIFEGGHVWLSSELALEAVEWLELQAMAASRRPRDDAWIEAVYGARMERTGALTGAARVMALEAMAADFRPFRDVSVLRTEAVALRKDKAVRHAFQRELDEERAERRTMGEMFDLERQLGEIGTRSAAMGQLRGEWKRLRAEAESGQDSARRRVARRVIRSLGMGVSERVADADYRKLVGEFRPERR